MKKCESKKTLTEKYFNGTTFEKISAISVFTTITMFLYALMCGFIEMALLLFESIIK
jgi:hypothetical protein